MRLLLLLAMLGTAASNGAGFDCTKAASTVERSICADPELSMLDEHLARYCSGARMVLKEGAPCLQTDQQRWLQRRNACRANACLKDAVATGDGYVVRAARGERHLLLPLMFIDEASATYLQVLAREEDTTFRVTGDVTSRDGRTDFESSRCIFIHRIAAAAEGRIFSAPAQPHAGFKPHQLAFATPKDGIARAEFRSQPCMP